MSESSGAGPLRRIHVAITSESANVAKVRSRVREFSSALGFAENESSSIELAIDEAICNVIKHGYRGQAGRPIDVRLERVERDGRTGLQVTIVDECEPVEPESMVGRDLDDVRPGGLGLHIMRTVMDEVEHIPREGGGMQIRMVKLLPVT
jgi:anti-sigma regulatory factor (Ser/Thr protein kinase)